MAILIYAHLIDINTEQGHLVANVSFMDSVTNKGVNQSVILSNFLNRNAMEIAIQDAAKAYAIAHWGTVFHGGDTVFVLGL
jgi:hypothetical protein